MSVDKSSGSDGRRSARLSYLAAFVAFAVAASAYVWWARSIPAWTPPDVAYPEPNAYDEYLTAILQVKDVPTVYAWVPGGSRGSEDAANLRAIVAAARPALARVRGAFAMECRLPNGETSAYLERLTYEELSGLHELMYAFNDEAYLLALECRWDAAAQSYLDGLDLCADFTRDARHEYVYDATKAAFSLKVRLYHILAELNADEAMATLRRLRRIDERWGTYVQTVRQEKQIALRELRQAWLGNDPRGAYTQPYSASMYFDRLREEIYPRPLIWSKVSRYYDALAKEAAKPFPQRQRVPSPGDPISERFTYYGGPEEGVNATFQKAIRDLFELELALQAHKMRHGAYPNALDALVPMFDGRPPVDPFSLESYRYVRADGRYRLWSVGPDLRDDDGAKGLNSADQGDILLGKHFPPK